MLLGVVALFLNGLSVANIAELGADDPSDRVPPSNPSYLGRVRRCCLGLLLVSDLARTRGRGVSACTR